METKIREVVVLESEVLSKAEELFESVFVLEPSSFDCDPEAWRWPGPALPAEKKRENSGLGYLVHLVSREKVGLLQPHLP